MGHKLDEEGVIANVPNAGTKTAHRDVGCMQIMASGKENGNERRALGRLNMRISGWLQSKKDDGKEDAVQDPPRISKAQLLFSDSQSPAKEQLALEADRVSTHEEVKRNSLLHHNIE
ncbi:uncharacterized protein A1O5_08952 [Cladophialophora psammophila CBS 110553]|uniref:Uncharacterized protein n=1 Tax=Cladophialophora psammophila CBS 110553 TaxID=1182543 RepID=W9WSG6_9EURO|nr:uncharacterized protein A1O5_08952 [Cladophialophora psammophila CBS 110553]EXJ67606.1 hypothetical protein A1O5_08952 [Cladophialophora psammophila CBS 110553]